VPLKPASDEPAAGTANFHKAGKRESAWRDRCHLGDLAAINNGLQGSSFRPSGSFTVQTRTGGVQGINHKHFKILQRTDGYGDAVSASPVRDCDPTVFCLKAGGYERDSLHAPASLKDPCPLCGGL
jgi:hypothetical protein